MPIHNDLHVEAALARFRAQRSEARSHRAASNQPSSASAQAAEDRVEISLSARVTTQAANGIMLDSVVEQINKALQEAGIDLKVEEAHGNLDTSPPATARRIVGFATGFLEAFRKNHSQDGSDVQLRGFMSLTRRAIEDGFQSARAVLNGLAKVSEAVEKQIDETFVLTNQFLDDFYQAQVAESGDGVETAGEAE